MGAADPCRGSGGGIIVAAKSCGSPTKRRRCRRATTGPAVQWAIDHQIRVGRYLGAEDFVPVSQAHIMADTELLGVAGVEWLERMAALPAAQRRVRIPTITDPRGTDFAAAHRLKQSSWMIDLERRAIARLRGARRADDQHLHQLSDHHAAGPRRARRLWRHRRRHLFEQRVRRALEFRRRSLGAQRRAHRPHPALRFSSRHARARDARDRRDLHAARARRLGRARRHRRPPRRGLLAGPGPHRHRPRPRLRRDEAFWRGARELRLGGAVPHGRHHAGGSARRTTSSAPGRRCGGSRSASRISARCRRATG